MSTKAKVFITIKFVTNQKLLDYPKHLPIPAKGDIVVLNADYGEVETVKHITNGNITEIRIDCIEHK